MNYGSHVVIVEKNGQSVGFFSGSEKQCQIWASGVNAGLGMGNVNRNINEYKIHIQEPEVVAYGD